MESDFSPSAQLATEMSKNQSSASDLVDEVFPVVAFSGGAVETLHRAEVEDLDSFILIEPPPLDWKSDSSSEVDSGELNDPSIPPSDDPLEKDSHGEPAISFAVNQQKRVENNSEPVQDTQVEEEEPHVDVEEGRAGKEQEVVMFKKTNKQPTEEEVVKKRSRDEDRTHIHTLLGQLQLMQEKPLVTYQMPPHHAEHQYSSMFEAEPPSLTTDDSTETTGLLFSESHQRHLLGMLQCTEISTPSDSTCLLQRGVVDAVGSVSYSQADAHMFWGHDRNGQQQRHKDNLLPSLPEEQPLWVKMEKEAPEEEAAADNEQSADHPSYKDVPGPCDPEDLLDGVIFGAKYLGSTQIKSEKNPSTNARMAQAQEAVDRIKAPDGESQPMTEVDLFISTQRIKVLTADTQEAMMDHSLQMISYIADIGDIVVLMARRKQSHKGQEGEPSNSPSSSGSQKKLLMICHVFSSEDAQIIAQAIGQAFAVAYQQFLQVNGIKPSDLKPGDYSDYLENQELYNADLAHFSDSQNIRDVIITKASGEILGLAVVESGWGSILPTVVVANLLHGGPAERCGELSIGDRIMSVNGTSLVGLPISTCQNIIRDLKNQKYVKLSIVHCPPVTIAIIKRPDPKFQLGFSVEDGIICSLMRGGIAERGGIRVGHRIIEINGQSVVATPHEKIVQILTNAIGEIHLKTMPASTYRLLTGQEQPVFL
ncbi:amyloid-beta A4 precursor protein-binding family A member 3 [Thalassophryne amazonica]|uniref:amyloid-beta A4 precursor protein-binding family A member 3 n=1 Tax=Thalassophryne amazonica TaxID=390379 RepID=UPI001470C55A|nr:amyloid-beta A4 precursor protein-binding family A member 3 [Thalassophryne amazonica]